MNKKVHELHEFTRIYDDKSDMQKLTTGSPVAGGCLWVAMVNNHTWSPSVLIRGKNKDPRAVRIAKYNRAKPYYDLPP